MLPAVRGFAQLTAGIGQEFKKLVFLDKPNLSIKTKMQMQRLLLMLFLLTGSLLVNAQADLAYQKPPQAIIDLVDAPATPSVRVSPHKTRLLLLDQPGYPSIAELAQPELRLAGVRINPATNGASRSSAYTNMRLLNIADKKEQPITGLPENPQLENVSWSPDGQAIAFTHTAETGIELWVADVTTAAARRLTDAIINDAVGGAPYVWLGDGQQLIYKAIPATRGALPREPRVPKGPTVQANEGKVAPSRTYQDLLKNPYDEELFTYFVTSQLFAVDRNTGTREPWGDANLHIGMEPSPDGNYLMITTLRKPFSYLVPYYRFGRTVAIYSRQGALVHTLAELPLAEDVPTGFDAVPMGPRNISWRSDAPATLFWVEAQDGGDSKVEVAVRDQLFLLTAPFKGQPQSGPSCALRFSGVTWGTGDLAIVRERWTRDRREITRRWAPDAPGKAAQVMFDRSYEDRASDPGNFITYTNDNGENVLLLADKGQSLLLSGQGNTPEGFKPFLDSYSLANGKTKRLWESEAPYYEYVVAVLDADQGQVLTSRENMTTPANYYLRNWRTKKLTQLTDFPNPFQALDGVTKELVKYQREDGLELTGTLYLPKGYNRTRDGALPTFMWAYPREYKSADAASQVTGSPYQFIRPSWGSPLYFVTQGYAVFDNFSMPILGEGDLEPNDVFVNQLRMNGEAAVNKLVSMGVADRDRIAVGGHSYGAFMTANLLAHTDLFAAGIARSGAYNRTLTPFGFQAEERTYWEAPEVYYQMSPFSYADQIKEPLLLIHGEADNNSGTFPIQSERFYNALKGHGATTRLTFLPHESHGYRARESILHMMWEMNGWLDKYVKNRSANEVIRP